jgi:chaperonin cofactor prefoldin
MKDFARRYWASFTPMGQFWLALGVIALAVDAAIAFKYGMTQTVLHAAGFALCAIFFAFLPDQAAAMWEERKRPTSLALWALCVPLGAMAYWSHLGYGAGVRVGDIQQTTAHNNMHKAVNKGVESEEKNIETWRSQLATKEKDRDAMKAANPWAAKTSPDALKADIANMEGDMIFKRSKECANVTLPDSRKFCDSLAKLKAQLGEFARMNKIADEIEKLNGQIQATQRVIDKKVAEAANVKFQSSSVVNQTATAGQLYLAFSGAKPEDTLDPDRVTISYANILITAGGSLAFMLMAPLGFFVAGRNRRVGAEHMTEEPKARPVDAATRARMLSTAYTSGPILIPRAA